MDGVEVYNSHNTDDENDRARTFAKKYDLLEISGGDTHRTEFFGGSGLAFGNRIRTNEELVKALKSREYKLIIKDELVEF